MFFCLMGDEVCLACSFYLILHCDLRKKEQAIYRQKGKGDR